MSAIYIETAIRAANWLESAARYDKGMARWSAVPGRPEPPRLDCSLYYGAAGIILFFLEMSSVTENPRYLELADQAASGAVEAAEAVGDAYLWQPTWRGGACHSGLYLGGAGIAVALRALARRTGDRRHHENAARACRGVLSAESTTRSAWNGSNDIVAGAAGIGLFCLAIEEDAYLTCARAAGDHLVRQAVHDDAGCWWPELTNRQPHHVRFPNFSHGTAGIAYYLASLYAVTRDERYWQGAVDGVRWLESRAARSDRGVAWYHHDPGGEDLYYSGWCHGPAGTARLFVRLFTLTQDQHWRELADHCVSWVAQTGLDVGRQEGLWNDGMCCGLSGIGDFLLGMHAVTGVAAHTEMARHCADGLIARATPVGDGLHWIQAEHRSKPFAKLAQVGYAQGAAGIGLFLLRLSTVLASGASVRRNLPDDPFRSTHEY